MIWLKDRSTFDPALLDVLDWRLGPGRGRLILLALYEPRFHAHADHMALKALGDCYRDGYRDGYPGPHASIDLTLSAGVQWDGETLTLPGEWPESMVVGLPGTEITRIVEHPALPHGRIVTGVDAGDDGITLRTERPAPMGMRDLVSPTRLGRLRDRIATKVEEGRFVRSHGLHRGIDDMTVLGTVLGLMMGLAVGAMGALVVLAGALLTGLDTVFEVLAVLTLIGFTVGCGLAMFLDDYHYLKAGRMPELFELTKTAYGRSIL